MPDFPNFPALTTQIIEDWKAKGAPQFLNVCENDGWAGCACPTCMSWDQPAPDDPIPFDQRADAALRAFNGQEGRRDEWMLKLGSLSDRYARFWRNISETARQTRPDVEVVSYIYDNYRKPPVKEMLNSNVLCGVVPQESIFGYSQRDSSVFRHDWTGWEKTGCALFSSAQLHPSSAQLSRLLRAHSWRRSQVRDGPRDERDRFRFAHQQVFHRRPFALHARENPEPPRRFGELCHHRVLQRLRPRQRRNHTIFSALGSHLPQLHRSSNSPRHRRQTPLRLRHLWPILFPCRRNLHARRDGQCLVNT